MSTTEIEITLKEMVQMALGVPKITKINVNILHAFFNVIMAKLDCKHEIAQLGGVDGAELAAALKMSSASLLPFDTHNVTNYNEKLSLLEPSEVRLGEINHKFERHLEMIRYENKKGDEIYSFENWERFDMPCDNLCRFPDTNYNAHYCKLLTSFDFMENMQKKIASPIFIRMQKMKEALTKMHVTLLEYKRKSDEKYEKIKVISGCLTHVENLHAKAAENDEYFTETIAEVQSILDRKISKFYLPCFKKRMNVELEKVDDFCAILKKPTKCPKINALKDCTGVKCLSCCQDLICKQLPITIGQKRKCAPHVEDRKKLKNKCVTGERQINPEKEAEKLMKPCEGPWRKLAVVEGTD